MMTFQQIKKHILLTFIFSQGKNVYLYYFTEKYEDILFHFKP